MESKFQFQNNISVADIINMFLLLVAVIGVFLTYLQTRQAYKIQKTTFFKDLYSMMFSDQDIRKAYQMIEYNKFVYGEEFHNSIEEHLIDRLLSFTDLVCYLHNQKMLTDYEMDFFKYEYLRVYENINIQKYLSFLENLYDINKTDIKIFSIYI